MSLGSTSFAEDSLERKVMPSGTVPPNGAVRSYLQILKLGVPLDIS